MNKCKISFLVLFLFLSVSLLYPQEAPYPRIALVLSGGAARGFAHIAVLELIEDLGIPIDMIVGVSAGAIIGGLYASGYSPVMIMETLEFRDWTSLFQDRPAAPFINRQEELPFAFNLNFLSRGLFINREGFSTGQRVYNLFKSLLAKIPSYIHFDDLPIPFRAGAVTIPQDEFVLLEQGDLVEAIRASMSIPGVFAAFEIDDQSFVDGGVINNLPVREVREMGFDIVIAVDLFAEPAYFGLLPSSIEQHRYADVVLFPLVEDVDSMDFSKGRKIYNLALAEREKMLSLLIPIRDKIFQSRYAEETRLSYNDIPPLRPQSVNMKGALRQDRGLVERAFARFIKDQYMEKENTAVFLDTLYSTGNYRKILARADIRGDETVLNVTLYPDTQNSVLFRTGFNYEAVFLTESSHSFALRTGIEFVGKDGFSLLLSGSILDELSIGFSIFFPLSSRSFIFSSLDLVKDRNINDSITPDHILYFRVLLNGGLQLNDNTFKIGPEFYWLRYDDSSYLMGNFSAIYTFNNFDFPLFPRHGFRFRLSNSVRILSENEFFLFNLASADVLALFPLNNSFGFGLSSFTFSVFGNNNLPVKISTLGLRDIHRQFYPHIAGHILEERQVIFSLFLQYEPWKNITFMGGRLLFLAAGTLGGPFEFTQWNGYFGTAFIFPRTLSVLLRAGMGGDERSSSPFISLDIGTLRF